MLPMRKKDALDVDDLLNQFNQISIESWKLVKRRLQIAGRLLL